MAAPIRYGERVALDGGANGAKKQFAPAADRNKEVIGDVLGELLAASERPSIVEISSGTGQHAVYFARRFPSTTTQPTDVDEAALDSINAYVDELQADSEPHGVVLKPLQIDCSGCADDAKLSPTSADVVVCANLLHISVPECTPGLMRISAHALKLGGHLLLYGPFLVDGKPTTDSNAAFDAKLKGMDPRYGLRDVVDVEAAGQAAGLVLLRRIDMPANNFALVFHKSRAPCATGGE